MSDSGHPSRHGFVRCARCETWRRPDGVQAWTYNPECIDAAWCINAIVAMSNSRAKSPETARHDETAPKPGWDANGAPIEQGGEL